MVEGGNDYMVSVKANQGKLYHPIETSVRYRQPRPTASTPCERQHGRQEQRFVVSIATTARLCNNRVRGHWSIENRLHWPKDVVLHEDDTYGRNPNALLKASLLRSITIDLIRLNGFKSVTSALRELANQVETIFRLLQ